jgi:hypothetical protein
MSEVGHAPAQSSARPTPSRASVSSRLAAQLPEYRPRPQVDVHRLPTKRPSQAQPQLQVALGWARVSAC